MKSEIDLMVILKDNTTGDYEYSIFLWLVSETRLDFREGTLDLGDHCINLDDIAQIWVQNRLIWHDNAPHCPVCGTCADPEEKIKSDLKKKALKYMILDNMRRSPFHFEDPEPTVLCNTPGSPCDEETPKELDGFSLNECILGITLISLVMGMQTFAFCFDLINGPTETTWVYFAGIMCSFILIFLIRQTIFRKIPLEQQVTQGECT